MMAFFTFFILHPVVPLRSAKKKKRTIMEISALTAKGLALLNDASLISQELFESLLTFTVDNLLRSPNAASITGPTRDHDATVDPIAQLAGASRGAAKEAGAALSTLLLEAAKHDLTSTELSSALEDEDEGVDQDDRPTGSGLQRPHLIDERREAVVGEYERMKPHLRRNLASIGKHFEVVTKAEWKLECVVRDKFVDRRGEVRFVVTLRGPSEDHEDGSSDGSERGEAGPVTTFACNVDQLQDLVAKLKNACKGLERVTQT